MLPNSSYADLAAAVFPTATLARAWCLEGGVSATTTALELVHPDGRIETVVVRESSPTTFKDAPQADALLQHDLVHAVHSLGLPVPRPRHVDTTCAILPSPFVIYDFVSGSPTGPKPDRLAVAMADLMARVHDIRPEQLPEGLPTRASPIPELESLVEAAVAERAKRVWRGDRTPTLVHGDFWPGNLLWHDDAVVALVDWEDAAIGDPLSDLACARVELLCATDHPTMQRFTERYLQRTRAPDRDRVVWDVYVSAAALESMDGWGLPDDALARRRQQTQAFLEDALARLATTSENTIAE